jgi:acylphosphatase
MARLRAVRGVVRGRVQGVAYRASFHREAATRGLIGWVRNQADGTVEFVLQGESARVQEVIDWAHVGPAHARVTGVTISDLRYDLDLNDLEIR